RHDGPGAQIGGDPNLNVVTAPPAQDHERRDGGDDPRQHVQERRLPRAARPGQGQRASAPDLDVDTIDGHHVAVALAEAPPDENRSGAHRDLLGIDSSNATKAGPNSTTAAMRMATPRPTACD